MIEPSSTDLSLMMALNGDGGAVIDFLMYYISARLTWVPLYLLLLWAVWRKVGTRKFWWFLAAVVLVVLLADQSANLAKIYLPKLRPSHFEPLEGLIHTNVYGYSGGLYGTISSHASNSMGVAVLISMILSRRWIWISLITWSLLVSYSRIYLGVHYPYDIALGLLTGALWGYLAAKLYVRLILSRRD